MFLFVGVRDPAELQNSLLSIVHIINFARLSSDTDAEAVALTVEEVVDGLDFLIAGFRIRQFLALH